MKISSVQSLVALDDNLSKYSCNLKIIFAFICFTLLSHNSWAFGQGEWTSDVTWDFSYYPEDNGRADFNNNSLLTFKAEYYEDWNDGEDSFVFVPLVRLDQSDPTLEAIEIVEASWIHVEDSWEIRTGIRQVSWGVTNSINPVDVINQSSFTGNLVNQSSLGQPMINLSTVQDWGILDLYILFGFEEQTFPGPDSRMAFPIEADDNSTIFPPENRQIEGLDYAVRWQHSWDSFEWALSYFNGRSRQADADFNYDLTEPQIISTYHLIQQFGFELLYIWEGWSFKFELALVEGQKERSQALGTYASSAIGVEYSLSGLFGSNIDLLWFIEYLYDEREDSFTVFFEHDIFAGGVFNFNDEFDSNIFVGVFWDVRDDEGIAIIQASRRLNDAWKLSLIGAYMAAEQAEFDGDFQDNLNEQDFLDDLTNNFSGVGESNLELLLESFAELWIQNGRDPARVEQELDELLVLSEFAVSNPDNKLGLLEHEDSIGIQLIHYF